MKISLKFHPENGNKNISPLFLKLRSEIFLLRIFLVFLARIEEKLLAIIDPSTPPTLRCYVNNSRQLSPKLVAKFN